MTQLIFLMLLFLLKNAKFTQTLNVGINLPITEDAYKGMTKFTASPQHNITLLLYKTQLSNQITFTEAWYAPHIHKSFHSFIFTSLKMSIPITKLLREKIFNITTNSLLYSVAHALYKTNTETPILVPRAYDLFSQRCDRRALVSAITGCREIHDIR